MSSGGSAPSAGDDHTGPVPLIASVVPLVSAWSVDRSFDYIVPDDLQADVVTGCVVAVTFGRRRIRAIVHNLRHSAPERQLAGIDRIVVREPVAGPPLGALLDWEARRYVTTRAASWGRAVPPRVRVAPAGAPARLPRAVPSDKNGPGVLIEGLKAGAGDVWVVRPDPARPRERLLSSLVAAAPAGSVLVGVPEVNYGSSVISALAADFPDLLRTDSAVSESDRSAAVLRLTQGSAIAAGGRSIVHAPAPDTSLIVIDEEHHRSFKEDRSPRYDARKSAVERARLQGCPCVFVSATPSVEAGFRAATGEWRSVSSGRDAERAARPIVEVAPPDPQRAIGDELFAQMRAMLNAGGRVAILAPGGGFARTMWCSNCRRSLRCPRCESGVVVEDPEGRRVRCPVCTFSGEAPGTCPSCRSSSWRFVGAGSRRHAAQLTKAFPRATVHRADPEALGSVSPPPDIYVTTWIGTKPSLRPDVSLVGVLDADALIRRTDFRASENAYHALAAMAEWAGPATTGGRLVIQASDGGHHSIQAVVRGSYDYFIERELEARKDLSYPPFSELVRVWGSPENKDAVAAAASVASKAGGRVLGPVAVRRSGRDLIEVLVKCRDAQVVGDELRSLMAGRRRFSVDVDPR